MRLKLLVILFSIFICSPSVLTAYDQEQIDRLLSESKQKFTGKKISLDVQEIPVRTLMEIISKAANKNIVVHDRVQGTITLNIQDVPWDQLLEVVLRLESLYKVKDGNVIIVVPLEDAVSVMGAGR